LNRNKSSAPQPLKSTGADTKGVRPAKKLYDLNLDPLNPSEKKILFRNPSGSGAKTFSLGFASDFPPTAPIAVKILTPQVTINPGKDGVFKFRFTTLKPDEVAKKPFTIKIQVNAEGLDPTILQFNTTCPPLTIDV